ncbi:MAG: hypothetical protein ACJ0QT_02030 [Gammaproteobacteria bacterium]
MREDVLNRFIENFGLIFLIFALLFLYGYIVMHICKWIYYLRYGAGALPGTKAEDFLLHALGITVISLIAYYFYTLVPGQYTDGSW